MSQIPQSPGFYGLRRTLNEEGVMKRPALFFTFIFIFSSIIFTQEVIENPEKPLIKKAGRVVELKEVLSIHDVGDDYYFKYPSNLKVAPDGSIFFLD
jgi:hypothetical protein